jgi:hypothetical protein
MVNYRNFFIGDPKFTFHRMEGTLLHSLEYMDPETTLKLVKGRVQDDKESR